MPGRGFYFVRGEKAALYYDCAVLPVDKLRNISVNAPIVNRFAQSAEMEETSNGAGSRAFSDIDRIDHSAVCLPLSFSHFSLSLSLPFFSFSLSFSLHLSLFLALRIQSESLPAVPRGRSSGESRSTINLDIPLDITWPRPATADKFYRVLNRRRYFIRYIQSYFVSFAPCVNGVFFDEFQNDLV